MNSALPNFENQDFLDLLHAESKRYTETQQPPEVARPMSFGVYQSALRTCPAPTAEDIAKEALQLQEYLQDMESTTTAFIVPVFFPPRHASDRRVAIIGFYEFDAKGFSTDGPFGNEGYYLQVLPAEVQQLAVDIRQQQEGVAMAAESIAMRARVALTELRQKVWG